VSTVPVKSVGRNVFGILRNLLELPESFSGPYQDLPPPKKQDEEPKR
jgi:hypothetical protein